MFLYRPSDSFLNVLQKKTVSQNFSSFLSRDITRSDVFFGENHSSVTSVVGEISDHATHRWKALKEYIPNMYTFMGQKSVIFLINSLIILTVLMKK